MLVSRLASALLVLASVGLNTALPHTVHDVIEDRGSTCSKVALRREWQVAIQPPVALNRALTIT